ncbi:MAG: rRNA pseudouridine synthase [Lachnobacterium sp.]|mgnify:FL=1|nr:rRNA pseudouridine synthase [Lachnobacterium sp.]
MIRLDKFLADAGYGTRSEVKKQLKSGIVSMNGTVCKKPEEKIDPARDVVTVSGKEVVYEAFSYYLFYKPAGCVTAKSDALHKTVMDYFPEIVRKSCSPVGRLDKDTEGLLLITNDGELNHHLMSPVHHVKKTYYAVLDGEVPVSAIQQFAEGVDIGDDKKTLPAELEILPKQMQDTANPVYHANLTISEGRFHQVKRMFETVGCHVVYLKRLSLGNLSLGELNPGEYRRLSEAEVVDLRK